VSRMRLLIGTSTKMNLTSTEAMRYCETLRLLVEDLDDRDLFVLPPYTAIWAAREKLAGSRIAWGAQDVHPADSGAHTGDVSAPMLADLGCSYVEVGHSERRRDYGETDEYVAAQVAAIQRWGMTAVVCVGETKRMTFDDAMGWIHGQLRALVDARADGLVVAYEPVWAIGVGAVAAEPAWVGDVHGAIHAWMQSNFDRGDRIPVIYGGSVNNSSAPGILAQQGVNGLFVGRSALDPVEFARIARSGATT
jgi:triosephosphate isomerase